MDYHKNRMLYIAVTSCFLPSQLLYGILPSSIELSSPNTTIKIGEALIVKLVYRFEEPLRDPKSGNIYSDIRHNSFLFVEVRDSDRDWLSKYPDIKLFEPKEAGIVYRPVEKFYPYSLAIADDAGVEYSNYSLILYNHELKKLVFESPGTYKLCVRVTEELSSNIIEVRITSQTQEEKCALLDPNSCDFIMGINKELFKDKVYYSKMISDLKKLIERCPDSLLAKLTAARLGLKSFYDAEKEREKARHEKRKPDIAIWDEAANYFCKGLELPNDFPLREKILYHLMEIECFRDNYPKAISYLDELGAKYPKGNYGRTASNGKEDLRREMIRQKPARKD